MGEYWKRVSLEALRRAWGLVVGSTISVGLSLIAAGMAIWGLSSYGSASAASDEFVARFWIGVSAGVSFLVLYFWYLLKVPRDWDSAKSRAIAEIEHQRLPRIRLWFDGSDTNFVTPTPVLPAGGNAVWLRAAVVNESSRTANAVSVVVTAIYFYDGNEWQKKLSEPQNLCWANVGEKEAVSPKDVLPSIPRFFDIISFKDGGEVLLRINPTPLRYVNIFNQPGKYALDIKARGQSDLSADIRLLVEWDDGLETISATTAH